MVVSLPYMFRLNFCGRNFSLPVIKTCYVICENELLFFVGKLFDKNKEKEHVLQCGIYVDGQYFQIRCITLYKHFRYIIQ
jgi:hypothetical protein